MPVSFSGMSSMVRALSVTSSPVRPSPRVAARSSRPSRYTKRQRDPVDLQLAQVVRVVPDLALEPALPTPRVRPA